MNDKIEKQDVHAEKTEYEYKHNNVHIGTRSIIMPGVNIYPLTKVRGVI